METYAKKIKVLTDEINILLSCNRLLRNLWLLNFSPELLKAMELISERTKIAETELDIVIEANSLDESELIKQGTSIVSSTLKV
ncbi:hypothetical protein AAKU64_004223 [Undibacterium sp. GrIS 1.8]|uniref:hypothetical protein n=1 Tax=Undibacterium sp. GrIS 1.8 TaxID=3143934 RepID=UPI0033956BCE